MRPGLVTALVFTAFALIHSLTVSRRFKRIVARIIGETRMRAYYRLAFTAVSAATTAGAAYVIWSRPDVLYLTPPWYVQLPARLVQLAGVLLLLYAFREFDFWRFAGVGQALEYARTGRTGGDIEGMPEGTLIATGAYGLVRHPMYLAGIVIFMFEPAITERTVVLRVLASLYFLWGMFIEDRRFANEKR